LSSYLPGKIIHLYYSFLATQMSCLYDGSGHGHSTTMWFKWLLRMV